MTDHEIICPTCGKLVNLLNLDEVITHGFNNCVPAEPVEFSSSMKIGEAVEYIKGKEPINLN